MLVGNGTREASPDNHKTWISKVWLYPYSQYSSYISFGTDKENLSNNQSFLGWWLFSPILMTFMNDLTLLL